MTVKPTYWLLFFLAFVYVLPTLAQDKITITGKVTSAEDKQPIHAASLSVSGKGIGTSTNSAGNFVLFVPLANSNDSLRISCIGYQTKLLAIADAKPGQPLNVMLQKNTTQLREVNVAYYDPQKIIDKAIARIPKNYINKPHITRGFYRMYTSKSTEPLELSEAVFDIYNFGYADKRADLFKLIKARDGKNQRDFHAVELGQKASTILNYDVVNHIFASGFLSDKGLSKHKFECSGIVDVRGYPAYEIDFTEKPGTEDDSFRGSFYVDTKTYAFVYFDYGLSPTALKNGEFGTLSGRILVTSSDIRADIKHDRVKVGYQKVGDKWVLSDVIGDDAMNITSPELKYDFTTNVKFTYQVTSVDTTEHSSFTQKMSRQENINDYESNDGEEFWKDYNILLADFNTEDVFKHIQAVNSATRLKDKCEEKLKKLPADTLQRIDALLKFYHDNGQFNGTALIKNKGKILLSKSYGYADKDAHTEANSHTAYNIGTLAQTFTSVIINQLVADGKLDLRAPIKTYIPYYTNGDVTAEQLLTQQSGIAEYINKDDYKTQVVTRTFTLKETVINFCSDTLNFKSGTEVQFSNSNFVLLALIAEEITGKPFATLLQDRIFTPLQMTDTYFGPAKSNTANPAKSLEATTLAGAEAGTGGISSSAEDLLKFRDALAGDKLLSPQQKTEMLKTRVNYKDGNAWIDYGLLTDKTNFTASAKHTINYYPGKGSGFSSMYVSPADSDSCIILLDNTSSFPQMDMSELLLNLLN